MAKMDLIIQEKTLGIDDIFKDDSIYPRQRVDEKRIEFFTGLMQDGTDFPNVKVVQSTNGKYILLDGFHRYSAAKKLNRIHITCDLVKSDPKTWRLLSVRFNFDTAQPLNYGEIKKAIFDSWFNNEVRDKQEIADLLGCSVQWVRRVTKDLDQMEDDHKLALAKKIKQEVNASIRDIADKVGWSKSKTHRMLSKPEESDETETVHATQATLPTESPEPDQDNNQSQTTEPTFQSAKKIIKEFDKFGYDWQPDQKETLYSFDGIRMDWQVETISEQSGKNPNWVRSTAYILLALHHQDQRDAEHLFTISEKLSVNIERVSFINYLFTHWPSTLPERKDLFQWILNNQSQYRDDRISEIIRLEHLYWHSENMDAEDLETDEEGDQVLRELPTDTNAKLSEINTYFENLKKYIRNHEIETALARDLMERLNHILIPQNRIQDHLRRFI